MDAKFITSKRVQILVVVIAAMLIGFGAGNALFHFIPESGFADKIYDGLFITGVVAYMWSWKLRKQEAAEADKNAKEIDSAEKTEEKAD